MATPRNPRKLTPCTAPYGVGPGEYDVTLSDKEPQPCKRFRRNDYVGPAIWGFHVPPGVEEGDRLYYDDSLFDPPHRSHYVVAEVDGRLACLWDKVTFWGGRTFAGFVG